MRDIVLIVHNVRSCHNVGSLLRTSDGIGVARVYLTGYTPYPREPNDSRLPHLSQKIAKQIHKTALGAENSVRWSHVEDILQVIHELRNTGYEVVALEQDVKSRALESYRPSHKIAVVVGREVEGLEQRVLNECSAIIEIPMRGSKESFNVSVAAAIGLYHLALCAKR